MSTLYKLKLQYLKLSLKNAMETSMQMPLLAATQTTEILFFRIAKTSAASHTTIELKLVMF